MKEREMGTHTVEGREEIPAGRNRPTWHGAHPATRVPNHRPTSAWTACSPDLGQTSSRKGTWDRGGPPKTNPPQPLEYTNRRQIEHKSKTNRAQIRCSHQEHIHTSLGGVRAAAARAEVASELEPSTPRPRTQPALALFFLATTSFDSAPPTLDPRGNRRWESRGKGSAASASVEEMGSWLPRRVWRSREMAASAAEKAERAAEKEERATVPHEIEREGQEISRGLEVSGGKKIEEKKRT
nr:unnamed protein product [Digitaria exilis]